MWCPRCEVDVATEVSVDGQALLCTTCGSEVKKFVTPSLHPDMRRARDLLARLAAETPADEGVPTPGEPSATPDTTRMDAAARAADGIAASRPAATAKPDTDRQFRVDLSHSTAEVAQGHVHQSPTMHSGGSPGPRPTRREDDGHIMIPAPHFEVAAMRNRHPGKSESVWGQLLAYVGVAVLTTGTALVLLGYFGGQPAYAPTGWLVATAGQMLLFLGVITLVSGGMQQTTHEVSSRVAHLDGRMIRIEQTAEQLLNGPHFGRDRAVKPSSKAARDGEESNS